MEKTTKKQITQVFVEGRDYLQLESSYGSQLAITIRHRDKSDSSKKPDLHLSASQMVELASALLKHFREVQACGFERKRKADDLLSAVEEVLTNNG